MEYMRTQASIEKFVIITMRDGRKKYVGRRYSFKMDYGYTVKINEVVLRHIICHVMMLYILSDRYGMVEEIEKRNFLLTAILIL